jgi:hypothetical protein
MSNRIQFIVKKHFELERLILNKIHKHIDFLELFVLRAKIPIEEISLTSTNLNELAILAKNLLNSTNRLSAEVKENVRKTAVALDNSLFKSFFSETMHQFRSLAVIKQNIIFRIEKLVLKSIRLLERNIHKAKSRKTQSTRGPR